MLFIKTQILVFKTFRILEKNFVDGMHVIGNVIS